MTRRLRVLPLLVLSLAMIVGSLQTVVADEHQQGNGGGNSGPDNGNGGSGNNTTGNSTANDTEEDETPSSADREHERRKGRNAHAWSESDEAQSANAAKRNLWNELPREARRDAGMFFADDGHLDGQFVSLDVDPTAGAVHNITTTNGTVLFETVYAPLNAETAEAQLRGNVLKVEGDGWHFQITDGRLAPMALKGDDDHPFILDFPDGTSIHQTRYGYEVLYQGADMRLIARVVGQDAAAIDPADATVLIVTDHVTYHLAGNAAPAGSLQSHLDQALQQGKLGAQMKILQSASLVYNDAVLYDDMVLDLDAGTVEGLPDEGTTSFVVTVDSTSETGKTIALSFQEGLLDPGVLTFRYFNIDGARTVEATIAKADDIQDVLDPDNDGTISEYWIVEDENGVQVLLSIPHFSIHKIELSSIGTFIVERPSLILGILGAIAVVGVATRGLFRRPPTE